MAHAPVSVGAPMTAVSNYVKFQREDGSWVVAPVKQQQEPIYEHVVCNLFFLMLDFFFPSSSFFIRKTLLMVALK